MPAYKDKAKGTWYASFYYEDWTGKKVKKMKRGFPTKREELEWERTFLQQHTPDHVSYTHLRAHETDSHPVCRLLLEKKYLINISEPTSTYSNSYAVTCFKKHM